MAHRSEPNQTSTRTHGVDVGDTREAVALVDGVNQDGVAMKYLQWKGGGYSCFVDPSNLKTPFFELVKKVFAPNCVECKVCGEREAPQTPNSGAQGEALACKPCSDAAAAASQKAPPALEATSVEANEATSPPNADVAGTSPTTEAAAPKKKERPALPTDPELAALYAGGLHLDLCFANMALKKAQQNGAGAAAAPAPSPAAGASPDGPAKLRALYAVVNGTVPPTAAAAASATAAAPPPPPSLPERAAASLQLEAMLATCAGWPFDQASSSDQDALMQILCEITQSTDERTRVAGLRCIAALVKASRKETDRYMVRENARRSTTTSMRTLNECARKRKWEGRAFCWGFF